MRFRERRLKLVDEMWKVSGGKAHTLCAGRDDLPRSIEEWHRKREEAIQFLGHLIVAVSRTP